jgi:hypothetical protein
MVLVYTPLHPATGTTQLMVRVISVEREGGHCEGLMCRELYSEMGEQNSVLYCKCVWIGHLI